MKKKISSVVAMLLVLCMLIAQAPITAFAAGTPTIVVSDAQNLAGSEVQVTIGLENNPGIVAMTLTMTYDASKVTLTEVTDAGVFGGTAHKPELRSPYTLVWVNDTATENFMVEGTIATLTFTIADSLEEGTVVPVEITYDFKNYDIYDKDTTRIEFAVDNGSITVGEPAATPIDDFDYEVDGEEIIIYEYLGTAKQVIIGETYEIDGVEYPVTTIEEAAFAENEVITSVVIPATVVYIGTEAFYDCLSLTEVTVLGMDTEIDELAIGYYKVKRNTHGIVEGFTLKGYAGSTAQTYAEEAIGDDDSTMTFVVLEKECKHEGGEATCKDLAICSLCGKAYGKLNADNHKTTEVRDVAAETCNTPGYTGDTWCLDCNTKLTTGTAIDPTGDHIDADGDWEADDTHHFRTCTCNTVFDSAAHTGGTATCAKKAVCSVCGVAYGDVDASNHVGTTYVVGQKEATCYEPGYTGDTYCYDCNAKIATGTPIEVNAHNPASVWTTDDTHHWKVCTVVACGNVIDKAEHTGGEATCSAKAVCSVCNVAYGSLNAENHKNTEIRDAVSAECNVPGYTGDTWCLDCNTKIATGTSTELSGHGPVSAWSTDETHHWKECAVVACGNIIDKAEHTGGEATCSAKAVCSVCNVAYGSLNAENHKNTEVRDAATASCNTPGYTGDTWCLDCNTKLTTGTVIDPTGDHVDANGAWETDGTYHFHTCGCGAEFDKDSHAGGTATCVDKAVCATCGVSYGEKNATNHTGGTEVRDASTASCNAPGYTGDTYCLGCNAKIADGKTIDPTGDHVDADGAWESNDTQHFHTCGCGTEFDKADHTGGEATCNAKAVCSVCNVAYGSLNANNHKNTEVRDAVDAECNTAGYTGDTWCLDCNTKIADGKAIDPTGNHVDADGAWESNGTQHFHTCDCGTEFDKADHTGGEATCNAKAVCSVCNVAYGELNANKHTGETEIRNAEETKCNKEGYTGDTYCKACDTKLSDGKKIDKIPHIVKEWTVSKEATTEATGLKTGVCSVCNETMTVETAKLVEAIKPEKIEGTDVKIEIVGSSNISEDVIFKAEEILGSIAGEEKDKVDNAVKNAVEKFEEIKENVKIGAIFDFSLILRETNTNGDIIGETELVLNGKVKVTVPVPETVINTLENLKLLHIKDDGTVETVPFTLTDGKATFEATGFSYYTFVGTEKASGEQSGPTVDNDNEETTTPPQTGENNEETTNPPKTGDNTNLMLLFAVMFVSASALTVLISYIKKKQEI